MSSKVALMSSPLGPIGLVTNLRGELQRVHLLGAGGPGAWLATQPRWERDDSSAAKAREQLGEYLASTRQRFELALAYDCGTEFQRRVWRELQQIPYGRTISYGELAARLGLPAGASRAVGAANGANPHAIVTPCHRVIGGKGELVGYAGGLELKRRLLEHEGALLAL